MDERDEGPFVSNEQWLEVEDEMDVWSANTEVWWLEGEEDAESEE